MAQQTAFEIQQTKQCSILLVGRSQTGKSTIIKTLLKPEVGNEKSGYSETKDPVVKYLSVYDEDTEESYSFTIIDTPGLQEHRSDGDNRSDTTLLQLSSRCLRSSIVRLNAVFFVSQAGKTQMLDLEHFSNIMAFLGDDCKDITGLVLTNCETFAPRKLDEFEESLAADKDSKAVLDYCKLGIVRMGCFDLDEYKGFQENEMAPEELEGYKRGRIKYVTNMRNNFIKKIVEIRNQRPAGIPIYYVNQVADDFGKEFDKAFEEVLKKTPFWRRLFPKTNQVKLA